MAIAQSTIDAVRNQVSIVSVVGERVRLERRGRAYLGLCPFHKEKTPSFNVSAERGFYHCFGCQASGNVITFLQQVDGLSFPEAVRELAERAGIAIEEHGAVEDQRQLAEARRRRDELYEACTLAADYFEACAEEHALADCALAELERRQLTEQQLPGARDVLKAFRVGYAPYGWDGLANHFRQARFNLRAAEEVGLIAQRKAGGGYYDRFRHRVVFAVLDLRGRVVAFSGRALEEPPAERLRAAGLPPATGGDAPPKYYNSPESPIYRKRETVFGLYQARQEVRTRDCCVLVEGNFDVVSLHARGIGNVAAPLGTAFTPEQAAQVQRFTNRVTLLFDGDAAGQKATREARQPCRKLRMQARVAQLPQGVDPDDLARQGGAEAVSRLLTGARPILEHLIDRALQAGFALDDAEGRAAKIREVSELIAEETDPVVRAMAERHADEVAGRLGILAGQDVRGYRAFRAAMKRATGSPSTERGAPSAAAEPPEQARSRSRARAIAEHVVGALVEYPELLAEPATIEALAVAEGELSLAIAALRRLLDEHGQTSRDWDASAVAEQFPPSLRPVVLARLVAPEIKTLDAAAAALRLNLGKLERLQRRRDQAGVVEELRKASASGDTDAELSLLEQQLARARARHGLA